MAAMKVSQRKPGWVESQQLVSGTKCIDIVLSV